MLSGDTPIRINNLLPFTSTFFHPLQQRSPDFRPEIFYSFGISSTWTPFLLFSSEGTVCFSAVRRLFPQLRYFIETEAFFLNNIKFANFSSRRSFCKDVKSYPFLPGNFLSFRLWKCKIFQTICDALLQIRFTDEMDASVLNWSIELYCNPSCNFIYVP